MATMLAFITTDANIIKDVADKLIKTVYQESFDQVSIDGDTSTSDMFILLANQMGRQHSYKEYKLFKFQKASGCYD
ncbi:MAG: bifunctional ornithine acetyltransferase/N-acetylglutamate synthase [Nitrospinota bacterium]